MTALDCTPPKGLYKRGDTWHARINQNKVCYTKSLKCTEYDLALARFRAFKTSLCIDHVPQKNGYTKNKDWARLLFNSAKKRAKQANVEFSITYEDVVELGNRSGMTCEVTGIKFSWATHEHCRISPYIPSLDRINCKVGYTRENIRLVCWAVNIALSDWGNEVFSKISKSFAAKILSS